MGKGLKPITELIRKLSRFEEALADSIEESVADGQQEVTDYVSEEQLYKKGITGDNIRIRDYRPYSPVTVRIKRAKRQPYRRVTLRDTGDFHKSFFVVFESDGFYIRASDKKAGKLYAKYGIEIMSLTPQNLKKVIKGVIRPGLAGKIKRRLRL